MEQRGAGDVAMVIKNNIIFEELKIIKVKSIGNNIDIIGINIKKINKNFNLLGLYRIVYCYFLL